MMDGQTDGQKDRQTDRRRRLQYPLRFFKKKRRDNNRNPLMSPHSPQHIV